MKIGKFAEHHQTTIDAVRHYMEMGLIVPEKRGGQNGFDATCHHDMEILLSMKTLGFSLQEIKMLFLIRRLGKLSSLDNQYLTEAYNSKLKQTEVELEALQNRKTQIEGKLKDLAAEPKPDETFIGIDLSCLQMLACPRCSNRLSLKEATIQNEQIDSGVLACSCGENYIIENGIFIVDQFVGKSDIIDAHEYISETDSSFLDKLCTTMAWMQSRVETMNFSGKTILELGTGYGLFLRGIYKALPDDLVYFAVDHDLGQLRMLKKLLEKSGIHRKIVFICADFSRIPLRPDSVDVLVDISGTSNYNFQHKAFLIDVVDPLVKRNAHLIGSYIIFERFGVDSVIAAPYRRHFIQAEISEGLKKLGYNLKDEFSSQTVDEGGKYESYIQKGVQIYTYLTVAERWG